MKTNEYSFDKYAIQKSAYASENKATNPVAYKSSAKDTDDTDEIFNNYKSDKQEETSSKDIPENLLPNELTQLINLYSIEQYSQDGLTDDEYFNAEFNPADFLDYFESFFTSIKEMNIDGVESERSLEETNEYEKLLTCFYADYMDNVYFEKSTNEECIALEKEMEEMGVRVTFSDNLEDARLITSAYRDMYEKGCKLPKEVIMADLRPETTLGFAPSATEDTQEYMPIFYSKGISDAQINPSDALPEWMTGIDYNSTDDPKGPVYHEVGHYLQNLSGVSYEEADEIWRTQANSGFDLDFAMEVSYYAMTGDAVGKEFVAEVFAGMMSGKEYSQKVMDLYYNLGGSPINN